MSLDALASSMNVPCSIESTPARTAASNPAGAMGMGRDLQAHEVGHVDDGLHLLVGEMLLEAARAGIEHAAGGHDLDDVDAGGGELAHHFLAFVGAGADRGIQVRLVDRRGEFRRKPRGGVGMAADDRQGRARNLDPRAREAALGDGVANGDDGAGIGPPRSRTVVNPPRAISSAWVRPSVVA